MPLNNIKFDDNYDVIVVGGGHGGVEASLACANMGKKTLLITMLVDRICMASCNPAIGGLAKGHLVYEIDALGGAMGICTDNSGIAFKVGEESMVFSDFVKRLTHLHNVAFKAVLSNDYAKAENCIIEYAVLKGMIGGLLKSCSKYTRIVMRRYRKILELVRDIADLV